MKPLSLKVIASLTLIITCLFTTTANAAGFHYQLDLTAKLVNTPSGELSAIKMSWVYDKELSAILMDGEDLSEAKREATLKRRAADIHNGLSEVKYFTTLYINDEKVDVAEVETYALKLNKESRLMLDLTLPLHSAQKIEGTKLDILVTDDSAVGLATFIDASHLLPGEYYKSTCQAPALVQKQLAEVDGHAQITETMTIDCRP